MDLQRVREITRQIGPSPGAADAKALSEALGYQVKPEDPYLAWLVCPDGLVAGVETAERFGDTDLTLYGPLALGEAVAAMQRKRVLAEDCFSVEEMVSSWAQTFHDHPLRWETARYVDPPIKPAFGGFDTLAEAFRNRR